MSSVYHASKLFTIFDLSLSAYFPNLLWLIFTESYFRHNSQHHNKNILMRTRVLIWPDWVIFWRLHHWKFINKINFFSCWLYLRNYRSWFYVLLYQYHSGCKPFLSPIFHLEINYIYFPYFLLDNLWKLKYHNAKLQQW